MNKIQQVAVIAASPKPPGKAVSDVLANIAAETLRSDAVSVSVINVRQAFNRKTTDEAFQTMAAADALVIVFPLYVFCLPGITMRFLQRYHSYLNARPERKSPAVYSVINCGFPEPDINAEASRVVGRFASAVGGQYGFGILIGGGGMATMNIAPVKQMHERYRAALRRMQAEIAAGSTAPAQDVQMRVKFARRLYFFMGNNGWAISMRKNGGRKKDLYRRPYQHAENT